MGCGGRGAGLAECPRWAGLWHLRGPVEEDRSWVTGPCHGAPPPSPAPPLALHPHPPARRQPPPRPPSATPINQARDEERLEGRPDPLKCNYEGLLSHYTPSCPAPHPISEMGKPRSKGTCPAQCQGHSKASRVYLQYCEYQNWKAPQCPPTGERILKTDSHDGIEPGQLSQNKPAEGKSQLQTAP